MSKNLITCNLHWVSSIDVGAVQTSKIEFGEKPARWQDITFTMRDGTTHVITAFLDEGYPGFSHVMVREETPKRRADDVPRQPALSLEPEDLTTFVNPTALDLNQ